MGSISPSRPPLLLDLHLIHQQLVLPSHPSPERSLFLSNIDKTLIYTVETVHFFAASEKSTDNVVDILKEGLGKLLASDYDFMAGRLRLNQQGRLEIHCNGRGALFGEAKANHTIEELGDITHPNPQFKKLVLQAFDAKSLDDLPLLLVQVTRFNCGGFVIGLGTNHTLVDGFAAVDFMQNYASVVQGKGLVIQPHPDRTCLQARSPPLIEFQHNELIRLSDLPPEVVSSFTDQSFGAGGGDISGNMLPSSTHVFRSFPFSKEQLHCLKQKAMADGVLSKCSSFDVITAHLWRIRAQATELKPEQPSTVFFAVDLRNRMKPPLNPHFCGNGVYSAHATLAAGELSEKPLSFCVKKIQEAIEAVTNDYVRSALDWGEIHPCVPAILGGCFFVAAWWKLQFNMVDFGWGKPIYCGPVVNGRVEFVLLLPNTSKDSCRIYLALEPHQMAKLEHLLYP